MATSYQIIKTVKLIWNTVNSPYSGHLIMWALMNVSGFYKNDISHSKLELLKSDLDRDKVWLDLRVT